MKGVSNTIIVTTFIALFLLSVIPLTVYVYTARLNQEKESMSRNIVKEMYGRTVQELQLEMMNIVKGDLTAEYNASSFELTIVNRGGSPITIERIIIYTKCNSETKYLSIDPVELNINTVYSTIKTVLPIREKLSTIGCEELSINALYIITKDGLVIQAKIIDEEKIIKTVHENPLEGEENVNLPSTAVIAIPIKINSDESIWDISLLEQKGFTIKILDDSLNPKKVKDPLTPLTSSGMKGGTTTTYVWGLNGVYSNVYISISGQTIYNLWIGYDPRNISKYNIMLTSPSISISIGSSRQTFCSNTYARVKIYGFRNTTRMNLIPQQDVAEYTFLQVQGISVSLSGYADRVEVYCRVMGNEVGYNPYILIMNIVRERKGGILFTSIDRIYGRSNSRNDYSGILLDYSTKPFVLVYKALNISNTNVSSVAIAINYRFHDNEGEDERGVSIDKPIMFVGLVDSDGNIYSYRSFTFRELTRYEDTYPPTAQAQSSIIFIPLPPSNVVVKTFNVFIAFQDPYSFNQYLDDLDFTLYIEALAIILFR